MCAQLYVLLHTLVIALVGGYSTAVFLHRYVPATVNSDGLEQFNDAPLWLVQTDYTTITDLFSSLGGSSCGFTGDVKDPLAKFNLKALAAGDDRDANPRGHSDSSDRASSSGRQHEQDTPVKPVVPIHQLRSTGSWFEAAGSAAQPEPVNTGFGETIVLIASPKSKVEVMSPNARLRLNATSKRTPTSARTVPRHPNAIDEHVVTDDANNSGSMKQ